jgi:hypothetical protein
LGDRDILFMVVPIRCLSHIFCPVSVLLCLLLHTVTGALGSTEGETVLDETGSCRRGLQCDETGIVASGGSSLTWQCGPEVVSFRYGQKREKGLERHHGRLTNRGTGLC